MVSSAIQQSIDYAENHRIGEHERVIYGFRDAGRGTTFDSDGTPRGKLRREIILAKSPDEDPILKDTIATTRTTTAGMGGTIEKIDWLSDHVAALMAQNDPAKNKALLDSLAGGEGAAGVEITLGQMIEAKTGVCRHRSLLFKVLADEIGVSAALIRGNYTRRGADRSPEGRSGRGGHAWNEVLLKTGERLLVDVMHNFVAEMDDPQIGGYAGVDEKPLYPSAGRERTEVTSLALAQGAEQSADPGAMENPITLQRASWASAPWVSVRSPAGGRSAYAYIDAMDAAEVLALARELERSAIRFDRYDTSVGGNGGKREVLRVRGASFLLLRRGGVTFEKEVPPIGGRAA